MSEIIHHKYVANIEPSGVASGVAVRAYCHWADSHNIEVSSNTISIGFTTFPDIQTKYTSEEYLYRRAYHYANSALQAQRIFFSGQPLLQFPTRPELLEPQDSLPRLMQPSITNPVTSHDVAQGFHVANIADLFPYLRWALRDYDLSFYFANYDAVVFIWRALASVLWHVGEGEGDCESDKGIKTSAAKLCVDADAFIKLKRVLNHHAYQGRHGTHRAAHRVNHFKGGTFERIFGSIVDESALASMFPSLVSDKKSPLVADAIDLAPPSVSNKELIEMRKFTHNVLVKFLQYLGQTSLDNLISRGIAPVFGSNPCKSQKAPAP